MNYELDFVIPGSDEKFIHERNHKDGKTTQPIFPCCRWNPVFEQDIIFPSIMKVHSH